MNKILNLSNTINNADLSNLLNKIHIVRDVKVILDFDMAEIFQSETRVLNQVVRRNIKRFPSHFMFKLTKTEWKDLSSHIEMTSQVELPKSAPPFAFTVHGYIMLHYVMQTDASIDASIIGVQAFNEMSGTLLKLFSPYGMELTVANTHLSELYQALVNPVWQKKELEKPQHPFNFLNLKR